MQTLKAIVFTWKTIVFTFAVVVLAACAYSPQQITVQPQLQPGDGQLGMGKSVRVVVLDQRPDAVIGSRGGLHDKTSTITAANDITRAIADAAEMKLKSMGFAVNNFAGSADARELRIIVDTLHYASPDGGAVGIDVALTCVLRAEVLNGPDTYQGRYQVKNTRSFFNAPSAPHNQQLINDTLSQTLERLFADVKLQVFILK